MEISVKALGRWLFGPEPRGPAGHLWARWIFLRAMGLIFFSAFYSLLFQIEGLIGPQGILPAQEYLKLLSTHMGLERYWYAPTLLWFGSGALAMHLVVWAGLFASLLLFLNMWPRGTTAIAIIVYLSFVAAARDFADYQSDGMLLAAGFISLFFAPSGFRPGLGESQPPSRAALFLLQWEWFRIYFESGVAKLASHDPEWRHLTAMDQYYQNGPLPTWVGWYAQQLPHRLQSGLALFTLIAELALCWMFLFSRRSRLVCFFILTPFQIGIILTANYAFLNYLVLALGFLLLDDRFLDRWVKRVKSLKPTRFPRLDFLRSGSPLPDAHEPRASRVGMLVSGIFLSWIFYATTVLLLLMFVPTTPLPLEPVQALDPFRFANQYGLFAVMTTARYEIEFQGSRDGKDWTPYPFRYKPQDPRHAPGIYAPYQPRFDWNLWFASLGSWRQNPWVVHTEELLLEDDSAVLSLFKSNPFLGKAPLEVRTVVWQYWFTDLQTRRQTGRWWNRQLLGLYGPALRRAPNGKFTVLE
jgi:Lipase maturation factor